ncbi:hypothetical protein FDN13_05620 [Caloramator sp. E03]|uniref:heparinase II/III domain-containing protein n=1 Tax=Caloramator sp. E03 TaxID=2576307 RepID=UPI00111035AD|nr:heparinase II/III family protein [Caloramator sp. E03]QCX33221.1 hypothetical protein FDN13_05620 [Caloramator sp. E03]
MIKFSFPIENLKRRKKIEVFDLGGNWTEKELSIANNYLLSGYCYINKQFKPVKWEKDIWNSNLIKDRSWQFRLHTLIMIQHLTNVYESSKNITSIIKAKNILLDWMEHNYPNSKSEMAWHDHSTALRVIAICKFFESWKECDWDNNTAVKIAQLIEAHCIKLSDPNFYKEKHNHGLDQDIALYVASTVFSNLEKAPQWRQLALERFYNQLNQIFGFDGSYLEHSPGYSYLVCQRLFNFLNFMKSNGDCISEKLENIIASQLQFITFMLQPDGIITPIGDTQRTLLKIKKFKNPPKKALDNFDYILNKGIIGEFPSTTDMIYPVGGYLSARNRWDLDSDTVHLIFLSSFHSNVHKHHDDLSITLFAHNQPILIDSGKYNYNYNDPERQYVESNRAHNTVVVDDMNTDISKNNIGKSGITDYYMSEELCIGIGTHCLYHGVVHQRTVIFLKPYNIIILDELSGYKTHKFEQIFNFYPNIDCKVDNNKISGYINDNCRIQLTPLLAQNELEFSLVKGQKKPLRGWCSIEYAKLTPSFSGSFIQRGKKVRFATHINLKPSLYEVECFLWEGNFVKISLVGRNLELNLSDDEKLIIFNSRTEKMIKIYNQKLYEEIKKRIYIESISVDKPSPQKLGEKITFSCSALGDDLNYAWYVYKDNEKIFATSYSSKNYFLWEPYDVGNYKIKVFIKDLSGNKRTIIYSSFIII